MSAAVEVGGKPVRCPKCEGLKQLGEFYYSRGVRDPYCKPCRREYARERPRRPYQKRMDERMAAATTLATIVPVQQSAMTKSVQAGGGTLTMTIDVNLFELDDSERAYVFELIEIFNKFGKDGESA